MTAPGLALLYGGMVQRKNAPTAFMAFSLLCVVCFFASHLGTRLRCDDSLDVVGAHGVGGLSGALLTGIFATRLVNPAGADGLLYGSSTLLGRQFPGALTPLVYAAAMTAVILTVIEATIGLRVGTDDEARGLDVSQLDEAA